MIFAPLAIALALSSSPARNPPASDLTLPPETARLVATLEGRGVQIYTCTAQPAGFGWLLSGPEAQLYNLATGKAVGRHSAGPLWSLADGSAIQGTLLHQNPADAADDVPWLLLRATPSTGSHGQLSSVTLVRRYNTHGGAAPAGGCLAGQAGQILRVPYSATYAFFSNQPSEADPAPAQQDDTRP